MTDSIHFGVLRVLTLEDPAAVATHGRMIEDAYPNVSTHSDCIPNHPDGLPDVEAEIAALSLIEDLGSTMADEGIDALLVSCTLDPAVATLDSALSIPVIGPGRSVAAAALSRGNRVGTLSLEAGTPPIVTETLGEHHHAEVSVNGAETTNFLTTEEGQDAIAESINKLIDANCDAVAPSCTGLTTSGVLPKIQSRTSIPVVDPVLSMGAMAYNSVQF